jgi:hypothetical protein
MAEIAAQSGTKIARFTAVLDNIDKEIRRLKTYQKKQSSNRDRADTPFLNRNRQATHWIARISRRAPQLFAHRQMGVRRGSMMGAV